MNRGTIACRRDPDDKAEWQFSLKKSVDWVKEEEKHQVQGEAANKVEAVEWMKLRAEGLLEDVPGNSEANAALQQVLGKEKVPKALQDREPEAEASAPASSKKKDEYWRQEGHKGSHFQGLQNVEASEVSPKASGIRKGQGFEQLFGGLQKAGEGKKTQLGKGQDHTV